MYEGLSEPQEDALLQNYTNSEKPQSCRIQLWKQFPTPGPFHSIIFPCKNVRTDRNLPYLPRSELLPVMITDFHMAFN